MSGWNMTGETLPNEEKANKAISDVQFKTTPFNGDVVGFDVSGKQQKEQKELNPPKFKFDYFTESKISLAMTKGEEISDGEVAYLRDKIDFYTYFAKEFNIPNPTPAKVVNMISDMNAILAKDSDIKKALGNKMSDGSEIGKASESFNRDEKYLISKEVAKYYNRGNKVTCDLLDYMYNTSYGIKNEPTKAQEEARQKLAANVQENYERIVNSQKQGEEKTAGLRR